MKVVACSGSRMQNDAVEAGREDLVALPLDPLDHSRPMQHSVEVVVDQLPLPLALRIGGNAVVEHGYFVLIVAWPEALGTDQRSVDQLLLAVTIHVGPCDVV